MYVYYVVLYVRSPVPLSPRTLDLSPLSLSLSHTEIRSESPSLPYPRSRRPVTSGPGLLDLPRFNTRAREILRPLFVAVTFWSINQIEIPTNLSLLKADCRNSVSSLNKERAYWRLGKVCKVF